MEWSGDRNAHNATAVPVYMPIKSFFPNSLNNVGVGSVSIGENTSPSAPYVFKNQAPIPPSNAFPFYNRK
jgi:hypothetical protein